MFLSRLDQQFPSFRIWSKCKFGRIPAEHNMAFHSRQLPGVRETLHFFEEQRAFEQRAGNSGPDADERLVISKVGSQYGMDCSFRLTHCRARSDMVQTVAIWILLSDFTSDMISSLGATVPHCAKPTTLIVDLATTV